MSISVYERQRIGDSKMVILNIFYNFGSKGAPSNKAQGG